MKKVKKATSSPAPTEPAAPKAPPFVPSSTAAPIIIGIGASAGGLEAFQQLLEALPGDTGLAFIYVQHLDPLHKSVLPDILKGRTPMRIVEVEDQMPIEANRVYINPPDREVAVYHGKVHLVEPAEMHGHRLPIDFFFRALARDQAEKAIGVVLSGTGSDGTLGIRAIKGAGGMTIAQDPKSARYDGMPRSAISTRMVDFVVPAGDIPRVLLEYVRHAYVESLVVPPTAVGQMEQIFFLLREQTGHDFALYKQNTIRRRIERRMAVHQIRLLDEYVRFLRGSTTEVDALFKDLLIGVTNFFRDPDAFRAVEESVIPRLCELNGPSAPIRIWVPGCSTGEEPYSLAMLLAAELEKQKKSRKVAIFATDIDADTIDVARTAVYPESIAADVPADRLDRYFTKENGSHRIAKRIREMVIFAVQDVLKDPPFSKLDLISCRNLLIYLGPELQRRLMRLFHAVLNPGGYLFLGASESVGEASDVFAQIDKKAKIYQNKAAGAHPLLGVTTLHALNEGMMPRRVIDTTVDPARAPGVVELSEQLLLESYAPAAVVVDERYDVVYSHGRTGRYLELPDGEPHLNIFKMARGDVLRELRAALHKAFKEQTEIVREHMMQREDGTRRFVRLRVRPFRGPRAAQPFLLLTFEEAPTPAAAPAGAPGEVGAPQTDSRVPELEREVVSLRQSLQSSVEEIETSNEELRSTNEELQSANEELQSTNEELETSKEELQSVNEELLTVNAELQKKLDELSEANNDLTNLLNSTEIGTVFLDNHLSIKRFTPAMSKLINLIPTDSGRPIADIASKIRDDHLVDDARAVLRTLVIHEAEMQAKGGRWYQRRILPYRTTDNVIDGVVVTFVDITEVREAQRVVEATLRYANTIVDSVRQPIVLLNKEGRAVQANLAFYGAFQTRREEVLGVRLADLNGGRWGLPELLEGLASVLAGGPPMVGLELEQKVPGLGQRRLRLDAHRTEFGAKAVAGEEELTLLTIEDITVGKA